MPQSLTVILLSLLLYAAQLAGLQLPSGPGPAPGAGQHSGPVAAPSNPIPEPPSPSPDPQELVVVTQAAVIRSGPGTGSVLTTLTRGEPVTAVGREGTWTKVRLADGRTGYVVPFALGPASAVNVAPGGRNKYVMAYFVAGSSAPSWASTFPRSLDAVTPWAFQVTAQGDLVPAMSSTVLAETVRQARAQGLKTYALVHNYHRLASGHEAFDGALAHAVLADPQRRRRAAEQILAALQRWQLQGVHIDLENVWPSDRQNLALFMRELAARLRPRGYEVSMAVPAKTADNPRDAWSGAFDYKALAPAVDHLVVMAYDENHARGGPGPVASIQWVERVVRFAVQQVPRHKLVLGVAGYGYDWPATGVAKAVTYQQAVQRAQQEGVPIRWDAQAQVPYYRYDDRQVWFEDRRSFASKLELVERYDLAGIALWRLGQEDPGIWSLIAQRLV